MRPQLDADCLVTRVGRLDRAADVFAAVIMPCLEACLYTGTNTNLSEGLTTTKEGREENENRATNTRRRTTTTPAQRRAAVRALQVAVVAALRDHPVLGAFPPPRSYLRTLMKALVSEVEALDRRGLIELGMPAIDSGERSEGSTTTTDDDQREDALNEGDGDDGDGPVPDEVYEWYMELMAAEAPAAARSSNSVGVDKNESATHFCSLRIFDRDDPHNRDALQSRTTDGASVTNASSSFVSLSVSDHFVNVGLALWPAAFVAIDLVATLLEGPAAAAALLGPSLAASLQLPHAFYGGEGAGARDDKQQHPTALRLLELGAGVGLTPVALGRRYRSPSCPLLHVTATDYQPNIIERCQHNIALNNNGRGNGDVTSIEGGGGVSSDVALLDWCEEDSRDAVIRAAKARVALAADCIYDLDVVPGLVDTARSFFHIAAEQQTIKDGAAITGEAEEGHASSSTSTNKRRAPCGAFIVAQTHRIDRTQAAFHGAVAAFARVRSFKYDAAQHALVPFAEPSNTSTTSSCSPDIAPPSTDALSRVTRWVPPAEDAAARAVMATATADAAARYPTTTTSTTGTATDGQAEEGEASSSPPMVVPLLHTGAYRVDMNSLMFIHVLTPL